MYAQRASSTYCWVDETSPPCRTFAAEERESTEVGKETEKSKPRSMVRKMLFLLPPVLNALAISRTDITSPAYRLREAVFFSTIATATYGILYPPSHHALVNYANGFFLSWYLIWSTNILFTYDIRSLRRLQVRSAQGHDFCYWEPIHETSGLRRFVWPLDLSTNFRGLGWMCTKPGTSWPPTKHRWCPATTYGLAGRLRKLAVDVVIFGAARILTRKSPNSLHGKLKVFSILARS